MSKSQYNNEPLYGCGCLIFIIFIGLMVGNCIYEGTKSLIKEAVREVENDKSKN